jgi:hypothetical protein
MKKLATYVMSHAVRSSGDFSSSAFAADPEKDENRLENSCTVLKGHEVHATEIVLSEHVAIPLAARRMVATLDSRTPRHKS